MFDARISPVARDSGDPFDGVNSQAEDRGAGVQSFTYGLDIPVAPVEQINK